MPYRIPYKYLWVYALRILAFSDFCIFIFVDSHILSLLKSLIQIFMGLYSGWLPICEYRNYKTMYVKNKAYTIYIQTMQLIDHRLLSYNTAIVS